MRVHAVLGAIVVAGVVLVGCGDTEPLPPASESQPSDAAAPGGEEAAIRTVVEQWGAADTAEKMCVHMSQAMKAHFRATQDCPTAIKKAVKSKAITLKAQKLTVEKVHASDSHAVAVAKDADTKQQSYVVLLKNSGEWKVDGQGANKDHLPPIYAKLLKEG
jgi:hypothetical protein